MLEHTLNLSAFLLCIGLFGSITSRNMVRALMCLELVLNAVNMNLVILSDFIDNSQIKGEVFSVFIISIAAAEATVGLAIVLTIYRNRKSVRIDQFDLLKW
uniref:NADH-plastoquinone oxidoreductase subunit 4L n=1 Tax=Fossombronia foveolata TaxID=56918 RepID=UPI00257D6C34|nr:NADH-plastoquinone oxidoreductase subunit 4L [Fossombronia foveolata]WIA67262.1 NADH-plastoquinone oxidoreductase subunit 4L [Fossombronia foveolata]